MSNPNKNENSEKEKWERLQELEKKKKKSLRGTVFTAAALAFTLIATLTPAITNETLRYIAGMYRSVWALLWGIVGIGIYNYTRYKKEYDILAEQLESQPGRSESDKK